MISPSTEVVSAAPRLAPARELLRAFVQRTGVGLPDRRGPRYLWTDAHAVQALLSLWRQTGEETFEALALSLVEDVHAVLGRHREDDPRSGWISGLPEKEGARHPAVGGLRIGKRLRERVPGEPLDAALEWDRDGQYFHYLTRWMVALDAVAIETGNVRFNLWARELAETAFRAFRVPGEQRLFWKMSVDLSRPQVPSSGQHDALDGLVVVSRLRQTAARLGVSTRGPELIRERDALSAMIEAGSLRTVDALGIGGLLLAVPWLDDDPPLFDRVLDAALWGLQFVRQRGLGSPASERLAFRELGLTMGLRATADLPGLEPYRALVDELESFWLRPENRGVETWLEHRDINDVMLASSLLGVGVRFPG